jgi:hypothetical protein
MSAFGGKADIGQVSAFVVAHAGASEVGTSAYKSSSTRNLLRTANSAFSRVDSFVEDDARSPDGAPADITRCALCHRNHSQMNDAHA